MKKWLIVVFCVIAVLLAGYAGYRGYRVSKRNRMMNLARQFEAKSDLRNATLCMEQVLRKEPQNLEAIRIMAEIKEAARSPSALLWRSRAVEVNPLSTEDRLSLARTAMVMGDFGTATNALEGVAGAERNTVAFHNIAGSVAAFSGQTTVAESHYLDAAKLDPNNQYIQLNLAVVRLLNTNSTTSGQARTELSRLSDAGTNSNLRCIARRELARDAIRNNKADHALLLTKQLVQETNSTFQDRILRLDVLRLARSAEFNQALAAYQNDASNDPGKIYELATWQTRAMSPKEALTWLNRLPESSRTNQTVEVLSAECYTLQRDWRGLHSALQRQNWAELDFLRHAFLARALKGQQLDDSAKTEWEFAVSSTKNGKSAMTSLMRLAVQWGWDNESEELLWNLFNLYPEEKWIVVPLSRALVIGGRTRSLLQLNSQLVKREPGNFSAKNDLALAALLLGAQEFKPQELAKEVFQHSPTNAAFASTYAFSLFQQGKSGEALKIMEQLTPGQLQDPSIAGYYGMMVLKATGNREKALAYLNWSSKSIQLPEEKKLFDTARKGL